jgi:hypothetical protein
MYFSWISSIYAISVFHYHPAKKTDQSEDTDCNPVCKFSTGPIDPHLRKPRITIRSMMSRADRSPWLAKMIDPG